MCRTINLYSRKVGPELCSEIIILLLFEAQIAKLSIILEKKEQVTIKVFNMDVSQQKITLWYIVQNRIEYKRGRHISDPCTTITLDPFCSLVFMHPAALHLEQSAVSCWQTCLQIHLVALNDPDIGILLWLESHSHKEQVRPLQMPAYICHTVTGLLASHILNKCPFK